MLLIEHAERLKNELDAGTNIVIWGYGEYGRVFHAQLKIHTSKVYIYDEGLSDASMSFDKVIDLAKAGGIIVITVRSEESVKEIYNRLISQSIATEKIALFRPLDSNMQALRKKIEGFKCKNRIIELLNNDEACALLQNQILSEQPFLYSRWGAEVPSLLQTEREVSLSEKQKFYLCNNAGMFSTDNESLKRFRDTMFAAGKEIDILCVFMFTVALDDIIDCVGGEVRYAVSSAMEYPFFETCSWTRALEGKKVLVIHPFAELIQEQYKKREVLFSSPLILPEFTLTTYKAVQSMGGSDLYSSWFAALDKMEKDISELDFDIALIGCGVYGMPLGAFIKTNMKKQAINIGGSLQILFGIKGKRWEGANYFYDTKLYNEHWVRPREEDRPDNYKMVEGGCYW